ncbi:hypothetical protein BC831DRAFT_443902 [Entophlyctis helioformis]|nr:hypothetical protein BC831DRAFT_443902 [Entophlyctis helioformis]
MAEDTVAALAAADGSGCSSDSGTSGIPRVPANFAAINGLRIETARLHVVAYQTDHLLQQHRDLAVRLKSELGDARAAITHLRYAAQTRHEQMARLHGTLSQWMAAAQEYHCQAVEARSANAQLLQDNCALQDDLDNSQHTIRDLQDTVDQLKKQVAASNARCAGSQAAAVSDIVRHKGSTSSLDVPVGLQSEQPRTSDSQTALMDTAACLQETTAKTHKDAATRLNGHTDDATINGANESAMRRLDATKREAQVAGAAATHAILQHDDTRIAIGDTADRQSLEDRALCEHRQSALSGNARTAASVTAAAAACAGCHSHETHAGMPMADALDGTATNAAPTRNGKRGPLHKARKMVASFNHTVRSKVKSAQVRLAQLATAAWRRRC